MNWRQKALVQRIASRLPPALSYGIYYGLQRLAGTLRRLDPFPELTKAAEIAQAASTAGFDLRGKTFLEVGTGRALNVPVGLHLCGARGGITVDLNPYLRPELVRESIGVMAAHTDRVRSALGESWLVPESAARLDGLVERRDVRQVLDRLNVRYHAPADAGSLSTVDSASIDLHCSTNVLEHVPPGEIRRIFHEARRILRPGGLLAHRIDLSDHFAHSDTAITEINFLQFSEAEWHKLAGNRFMYHNRLRAYEFDALFREAGMRVLVRKVTVRPACVEALERGLKVDPRFAGHSTEELATVFLTVVASFDSPPAPLQ